MGDYGQNIKDRTDGFETAKIIDSKEAEQVASGNRCPLCCCSVFVILVFDW